MDEQLAAALSNVFDDADKVEVHGLEPLPGGFSRETFRFDATISGGSNAGALPLILRQKSPSSTPADK